MLTLEINIGKTLLLPTKSFNPEYIRKLRIKCKFDKTGKNNLRFIIFLKYFKLDLGHLKNIKSSVVRKLFMVSKLFINNLKNKSNLTNFLIVNECSYLLNSFSSNKSTNRKVFSFSRQKRFKSV